jgi:hypothetical protein
VSITGLHIPHDRRPLVTVTVNERDAMSYYAYVQGGPVEAGYLTIEGRDLVIYVNSRYLDFDMETVNPRAAALFELAGLGTWCEAIRGDALLVLDSGDGEYERSLPPEIISILIEADSAPSPRPSDDLTTMDWDALYSRLLHELPRALQELSVGGVDLPGSRYVQWAGFPEGLHIEVVGNAFLEEPLSFPERRALQMQQWQVPEPPEWPNFFRRFEHPIAIAEVAATLVDAAKALAADAAQGHAAHSTPTIAEPVRVGALPFFEDEDLSQRNLFDDTVHAGGASKDQGTTAPAVHLDERRGENNGDLFRSEVDDDEDENQDDPWAGLLDPDPAPSADQHEKDDDEDNEEDWEPLDDVEIMGDLSELLNSLPTVWTGNGEREFMIYGWSALKAAGVVPCTTPRKHLRAVATLAALHLMRVSFYVRSHDEGTGGVESWGLGDLTGDYPRIHPYGTVALSGAGHVGTAGRQLLLSDGASQFYERDADSIKRVEIGGDRGVATS